MQQKLQAAGKALKIKVTSPFDQLSKRHQQILLHGGDGFEGVVTILQDTFERATDEYREWLTEYMSPVTCAACHGKRLRPSSLSVRVKNLSIDNVVEMPIARALLTVRGWELPPREKLIAGRVVEEIQRRPSVPERRRAGLSQSRAVGRDAFRRRVATHPAGNSDRIEIARGALRIG